MCSTVFITSSPLHILYSLAIIKTKKYNNNYVIVWFGALPLENYFSSDFTMEYCNILDLSYLDFNHYYRGVRKHYNLFLELISNKINSIDYLFTCFDTQLGFEVIRNHFSVDWSRVGIIEDGIGNYFPNRMPKLIKQIPKSILNKIQHSFFLNVTRNNLGGNPKIGILSTLSPERVYINKKSNAEIISIFDEFKSVLNMLKTDVPEIYKTAEVLVFLSPVLRQKRMRPSELIKYLKFIKQHPSINKYNNILIKPHPREDLTLLKEIVEASFDGEIIIGDLKPIEMYLMCIKAKIWAGMPTTGMFNNYLLFGKTNSYIIFPVKMRKSHYTNVGINALKELMGEDLTVCYYNM